MSRRLKELANFLQQLLDLQGENVTSEHLAADFVVEGGAAEGQ